MALLFIDGFDAGDYAQKWSPSGTVSSSTVSRLGVGRTALVSGTGASLKKSFAPTAQVFVGFAFTTNNAVAMNGPALYIQSDGGATSHVLVGWNGGVLTVWRGTASAGNILATATVTEPQNSVSWVHIEVAATIHDTTGTVVVRVNGEQVLSFTGDTRNAGTSTLIDGVSIIRPPSQGIYVDDFYLCNGEGATHNTFLGDVRVHTVVPTGAGSSTQLTPSTGANWAAVDELPYSATDYVSSATAGQKDLYALGDLPASPGTIVAVQHSVVGKKTDAGARSIKPLAKVGGTEYAGAASALGTSDGTATVTLAASPATSAAWTASEVNGMEIGVEVV